MDKLEPRLVVNLFFFFNLPITCSIQYFQLNGPMLHFIVASAFTLFSSELNIRKFSKISQTKQGNNKNGSLTNSIY